MKLSKEEMSLIVERNLKGVCAQIYDLTIAKTVNDRVGETEAAKAIVEKLIKTEKIKNEYEKILKELNNEQAETNKKTNKRAG